MGWPHRNRVASPTVDTVRPGEGPRYPDGLTKDQRFIFDKFHGKLYFSNQLDVQTGRLWDCLDFEAGEHFNYKAEMFTVPIGEQGKTLAETNMNQGRRLSPPEAFAIDRIVFTFSKAASPEDIQLWMDHVVFRLWVGQKFYVWSLIGHMQTMKEPGNPIKICEYCQAVFVESLQCPGCGARSFKLSTLGSAEAGQQFFMDVFPTVVLANQINFFVTLESRESLVFRSRLRVWCHFEGLHARGVS